MAPHWGCNMPYWVIPNTEVNFTTHFSARLSQGEITSKEADF